MSLGQNGLNGARLPPLVELAASLDRSRLPEQSLPFVCLDGVAQHRSVKRDYTAPPIVVVEPHADDAVFSLGGFLLSVGAPIEIVTVFSGSASVHPHVGPLLELAQISPKVLRTLESERASSMLGARWSPLGIPAVPDLPDQKKAGALQLRIVEALKAHLHGDPLVLFPAAFGEHPDHVVLSRCEREFPNSALYEDVAPGRGYARCTEEFWRRYQSLRATHAPVYWPIDHVVKDKASLAAVYRSQCTPRQTESLIHYAESVGVSAWHLRHEVPRGHCFERLYVRRERLDVVRRRLGGAAREIVPRGDVSSWATSTVEIGGAEVLAEGLKEVFARRKTGRALTGLPIPKSKIGAALELSARGTVRDTLWRFPYPTTGGLGSTGVSVLPWNVDGLEPVAYRYNSETHLLEPRDVLPLRSRLHEVVGEQDWVLGASVGFLIDGDVEQLTERYGAGSWQLLLMECGHFSQALQGALCALDMQCVLIPGFDKPELETLSPGRRPLALILASDSVPLEPPKRAPFRQPMPLLPPEYQPQEPTPDSGVTLRAKALRCGPNDRFWVARSRIPTTRMAATGWGLELGRDASCEPSSTSEKLAICRAVAEAREIFSARTARADAVVMSTAAALKDAHAVAGNIVMDRIQRTALEQGKTVLGSPETPRYWIRMAEIHTGAPVWVPTDAVFMDRRFYEHELLPTSTGLACRPRLKDAVWHAVLEVFEKAIGENWSLPWNALEVGEFDAHPRLRVLNHALRSSGEDISVGCAPVAGLWACRILCQPSGAHGGAVRAKRRDALEGALGECLSQVVGGVGESRAALHTDACGPNAPSASGVATFLSRARLGLAYLTLQSIESDVMPPRGWPVVKVVAWRRE